MAFQSTKERVMQSCFVQVYKNSHQTKRLWLWAIIGMGIGILITSMPVALTYLMHAISWVDGNPFTGPHTPCIILDGSVRDS